MMDGESRRDQFTPFLIPIGGPLRRTADRRVLLAGDAGGFVNGFSAEGIYYAMVTGDLAAEAILDARRESTVVPARAARGYVHRLAQGDRGGAARLRPHSTILVPQRSAHGSCGARRQCQTGVLASARRLRERAPVVSGRAPQAALAFPQARAAPGVARVPSQAGAGERMTRAVLFDLDDTLFDHHRSAGAALLRVHEQLRAVVDVRRLRASSLALPRRDAHRGARRPGRNERGAARAVSARVPSARPHARRGQD